MYEGLDTVILYEELAYQDVVPVVWRAGLPNSFELQQLADGNLRLLQASWALQEQPRVDKIDENSPVAADIQRLDMKMNLLLDLMGRLLSANQPRPAAVQLRFNAHGATFHDRAAEYTAGSEGILEIHLLNCLPEPLRFAGHIAGTASDGAIKIRFAPLGETVADLIEKLAFRRHRRSIAGAKQPKKG